MDNSDFPEIFATSESFDQEVRELMRENEHLSLEEAQYLVTVQRLHGYKTHVWI